MQPKQRKKAKKIEIFSEFSHKMDEEDKRSPSQVYYPEDLETFDTETETGIAESQEAIDDFINQQKSANTNKKTATDLNTLLCYMDANGMKNEKIESLPGSELDLLLSNFFGPIKCGFRCFKGSLCFWKLYRVLFILR